jgi:hypothetical protein
MDRPKDRFIHQSAFLFYFFMTAGVLIVAAGSLLQHYFALRHPVFIPMHIELEMSSLKYIIAMTSIADKVEYGCRCRERCR